MNKTRSEIFSQCDALKTTLAELDRKQDEIRAFFSGADFNKIVFTGCGSSYCVAKSAAAAALVRYGKPSYALCSGDLFLNADTYRDFLNGAALVSFSRSGCTSEVILAVNKFREFYPSAPYVSVCEMTGSELSKTAGFVIELPWAYDESVCQTRSVSNMYLAGVSLAGILARDEKYLQSLSDTVAFGSGFIEEHNAEFERIASLGWESAVVLADGILEGIGEEAALAFKEICMIPSNYYHFLDVRHGPIVLINEKTLVIAALSPGDNDYQLKLVEDILNKGATVISLGGGDQPTSAHRAIQLPADCSFAARGLPLVFTAQLVSFYKAVLNGVNPDEPNGLSAWIAL